MMQRATCITLRAAQEALSVRLHEQPIYGYASGSQARLIERWSLLFDCYIMLLTFARNKNAY